MGAGTDVSESDGSRAGKTPTAFLSHSSVDAEVARRLARDLRAAGVDVWYDEWEIKLGDSLRRKIDAGIDAADYFLVLLSPASLKSEWVQTELDAGLVKRIEGKCRLIPILWDVSSDDVPATLKGCLWRKLEPYEEGLRKLVEACHNVSTKPPLGQPPAWARERPLEGSGLIAGAQRVAAWINQHSEHGTIQIFHRDEMMKDLELDAEQVGMAASELEDYGFVKLYRTAAAAQRVSRTFSRALCSSSTRTRNCRDGIQSEMRLSWRRRC